MHATRTTASTPPRSPIVLRAQKPHHHVGSRLAAEPAVDTLVACLRTGLPHGRLTSRHSPPEAEAVRSESRFVDDRSHWLTRGLENTGDVDAPCRAGVASCNAGRCSQPQSAPATRLPNAVRREPRLPATSHRFAGLKVMVSPRRVGARTVCADLAHRAVLIRGLEDAS